MTVYLATGKSINYLLLGKQFKQTIKNSIDMTNIITFTWIFYYKPQQTY